jgi:hypothetical protein
VVGIQHQPFFSRQRIEFSEIDTPPFEPSEYIGFDWQLARVVESGLWRLHETFDGTYTIDDLLDAMEILDVQAENRARAKAALGKDK